MGTHSRKGPLIFAIIAIASLARPSAVVGDVIDYGTLASRAMWDWRPEMADPLYCAGASQADFTYMLEIRPGRWEMMFSVRDGEKELYRWRGHHYSVFRVAEGVLYYADFAPTGDGGTIVAVDLKSGAQLWRERLVGAKKVPHSAASNRMTLEVNADVVTIYGTEFGGQYLEFKDIKTGKTIANRRFTKQEVDAGAVRPH